MNVTEKTDLMFSERHSVEFTNMIEYVTSIGIKSCILVGSFIKRNSISSMSTIIDDIGLLSPKQLSKVFDGCYEVVLVCAGSIKYKIEL